MKIVLIGLSGAGKSTVGAALAASLGLPFADADDLIVAHTGRSIADIFTLEGEAAFRMIEQDVIATALAERDGVLALGGGAVTTAQTRDALRLSGAQIVLLTAGSAELAHRVQLVQHAPARPLLAGDAAGTLAAMATERAEQYRSVATLTVDTSGRSVDEVTAKVAAHLIGLRL